MNTDDELVPTVGESLHVLRGLLAGWHSRAGTVGLPKSDGTILPAAAIHVQVEHSIELTESIILLIENQQYLTTAPLIRLTMECAVTAAWWASKPQGVHGSMLESVVLRKRRADAMRGDRPENLKQSQAFEKLKSEYSGFASIEAKVFEKRCNAISGGEWIYPYYRLLSESSHGGPNLLDEYTQRIEPTSGNPDGIGLVRRPHYQDLEIALGLQVMMLTLAIGAWDSLTPKTKAGREVWALATELGFGPFFAEALHLSERE